MVDKFNSVLDIKDCLLAKLDENVGLSLTGVFDNSQRVGFGFSNGVVDFGLFDELKYGDSFKELSLEISLEFPKSLKYFNHRYLLPSKRSRLIFKNGVLVNVEFGVLDSASGLSKFKYGLSVPSSSNFGDVVGVLSNFISYNFSFIDLHKALFKKSGVGSSCLKKGSLLDESSLKVESLEDELIKVTTMPYFNGGLKNVFLFADYVCDKSINPFLRDYFFPFGRLNSVFKDAHGGDSYLGGDRPLIFPQISIPSKREGVHRVSYLMDFSSGPVFEKEFYFILKSARSYVKDFVDLHKKVVSVNF